MKKSGTVPMRKSGIHTRWLLVFSVGLFLTAQPLSAQDPVYEGLAAGGNHDLAVLTNGLVTSAGRNGAGQLGTGNTTRRAYLAPAVGLSNVIALEGGDYFSLALRADATVWSFGSNTNGQLGLGDTSNRTVPTQITHSNLTSIIAVAAGAEHSLALHSNGLVYGFGEGTYGRIGDGTTTQRTSPVQVTNLSGVSAIAAGDAHSLAISNGLVYAWGYGTYGRLGYGGTTNRTTPTQVSGLSNVIAIAAGGAYSLALKSDSTVWSWGYNTNGQLGDGTLTQRLTPVQVTNLSSVCAIAAGNARSLALLTNGLVRGWGANSLGQIGDGTTTTRKTNVAVLNISNVVAIAAGDWHSLALTAGGAIFAWGDREYSQLADMVTNGYSTVPVPTITAIQIEGQPQNQTVILGNTANFNLSAIGSTPLTYQWRLNGTGLSGATNSALAVENAQPADEGSYGVVLSNAPGSVTSSVGVLTVQVPAGILVQPTNQTVFQGNNATFHVSASGTSPLNYQWRFNGTGIAGATVTSYSVLNAQETNAGSYAVVVTNVAGSDTSSNALLTVIIPPSLTTQPQGQTVNQGSNAAFTVTASGTTPLNYQWRFNGADLGGATEASLTLSNVQGSQAGSYAVVVTNAGGSDTSSQAVLTVNTPPVITGQPTNRAAALGNNTTFTVSVTGTAPLGYQWQYNGTNLAGATGSSYTLTNVQWADAGIYAVVVTNSLGSVTSSNAILMVMIAPSIIRSPESLSVVAGTHVLFTVVANGARPLSYQWRVNGGDIAGATNGALSFIATPQQASYSVRVSNPAGAALSDAATLDCWQTQPPSPPHDSVGFPLSAWSFNETNWLSAKGHAPTAISNVDCVPSWSSNALQLDSTNAALLQYLCVETNGATNLTCDYGGLRFWFQPNWSGTNLGGTGPGAWGRLLEVGAWSTNASNGWWSLYLNPEGTSLHFSGQADGEQTDYLTADIAWASNEWHQIALTYSPSNTVLYLDGVPMMGGLGVTRLPGAEVWAEGFRVGSDASGQNQARGQFEILRTFDAPFSVSHVAYNYAVTWPQIEAWYQSQMGGQQGAGTMLGQNESAGMEGASGAMSADSYPPDSLWLEITSVTNNAVSLIVHGTQPDLSYELLSKLTLTNAVWTSEQTLLGATGTNLTPTMIPLAERTNFLFFWARNLTLDTDGGGLPDWWQMDKFGHLGIDPSGDPDGDGWNNWQEYQRNTNPTGFDTPPAPQGLTASINPSNEVVILSWLPSSGAVTGYTIFRYDYSPEWTNFVVGVVGLTNQFVDTTFPPYLSFPQSSYNFWSDPSHYFVQANYAQGDSDWSTWVSPYSWTEVPSVSQFAGPGGSTVLAVTDVPAGASYLRLTRVDNNYLYEPIAVTNYLVAATSFTNGFFAIPDELQNFEADDSDWYVQAVWPDGQSSRAIELGNMWPRFFDGSNQLKQNVAFLLRAAGLSGPFYYSLNGSPVSQPTNYAYASYHDIGAWDGWAALHWSGPFTENYRYRNLVFATNDVASSGQLNTGASGDSAGNFYLQNPLTYVFVPPTNGTVIAGLLSPEQSPWMLPYPTPTLLGIETPPGQFYLPNNITNWFGLRLLSVLVARASTNEPELAVLSPGGYAPYTNALYNYTFYPEFEQPVLQTVGYYFAHISNWDYYGHQSIGDPLPGYADFSPTNAQPLLIASVGQPLYVAGFAKQVIVNGNTSKFVYLAQYFDKAYKADTNGVATTNETGILSPYGIFVSTEPGPVVLTTKPDPDQGGIQGTCLVQVVSLQLDANHDGAMDLSLTGTDSTSESHPFTFWVNNDHDEPASGSNQDRDLPVPPNGPDYTNGNIRCQRNLEDFARLWVCGLPLLATNQGYTTTLGFEYSSRVNLYPAYEADGGTRYLTDTNVAAGQIASLYGERLAEINGDPSQKYPLPVDANGQAVYTHFLFDGIDPWWDTLTLTVFRNGQAIARAYAYLDFHNIKDLYERAEVTEVIQSWPEMVQQPTNSGFRVLSEPSSLIGEANELALFVHGWRMTEWDYENFSDTMFKRLYWQGFQGRFASLRWPTRSADTDTNGFDLLTFNRSEHIAFDSGVGAALYLYDLRQRYTNYTISACAHSQGNIVMMQALKELAAESLAPLDNFVMMQAAVPAHCYDLTVSNLPALVNMEASVPTPNTYANYASGITNALRANRKIVNFFNSDDFALATGWQGTGLGSWEFNQQLLKPLFFFGYGYIATNDTAYVTTNHYTVEFGITNLQTRIVTDVTELMPFVARPRSKAVGAQGGVQGQIQGGGLDLKFQLGFGNGKDDHSGEFNRNIQEAPIWPFYDQLMISLFSDL